ncbi:uncharacterized protein LOC123523891 [Mercenaria mercenaria]|uniref:uncharacterized protein LOC123523891 n=1 Tax=Mercenaria mercenaria TaxID=6596 RepID=UPI00234E59BA|nr:uncharacterized protein LOC123523891 [Mercenaria mercenaria]
MKPKSSGLRARRSLTFEERPYAGKTFYVDVKSASAKSKISQRIQHLGGQIENFLSKDLSLLITDKNSTRQSRDDCSSKQAVKSVPLSRGQALLLKASANQNCDSNNNSNGLLQSAAKLGIKIETPAGFLRDSSKLLEKLAPETPPGKLDTSMSGMSPITWDSEKENGPVIKVEDEDGLYRPLFKQFESFPQVSYNETGSPFDVGVVLTKVKESNNQSKKKSAGGVLRGGYCESCDHWYKCSLREHLNSEKHKEFISVAENFTSLNHVSSCLPNLGKFVGKYGLKDNGDSPEILSDTQNLSGALDMCESDLQDLVRSRLSPGSEENRNSKELGGLSCHDDKFSDTKQKVRCRNVSRTEPILEQNCNLDAEAVPNTQPVKYAEESLSLPQYQSAVKVSATDFQKKLSVNTLQSDRSEPKSEYSNRSIKASMSKQMGRMFSVDDVIASVTENDDYFSSGDEIGVEGPLSKTSCIITKHLTSETSTNVSSSQSLPDSNSRNVKITAEDLNKDKRPLNIPTGKSKQDTEGDAVRFQNIPMMHFSSSSFGDNGVSNVISLLNSQHSRKSCDRDIVSGIVSGEENSVVDGSCSGKSSWALEKLSDISDSGENALVANCNVSELPVANGNVLEHLIDEFSDKENDMPVLEAVVDMKERGAELDLMPTLDSYDSADIDMFCKSISSEDKVNNTHAVLSVPLPEYSNITEESLQDKPHITAPHILSQNLQTNYEVPIFNIENNVIKKELVLETPDKDRMNTLKSKIYKNKENSGSTIRNWLLPNNDSGSVRSVQSPGNLNATLVNTSYNIVETSHAENGKDIEKDSGEITSLNDMKETADRSKVADWIQRQDFVVAENVSENSRQGFEENIVETGFPHCDNEQIKEENENEAGYFKDLKSCSEKRYGSEKQDFDFWSESGTSISDCTLDNFKIGRCEESNVRAGIESDVIKETVKDNATDMLTHDEMSQDSDISAKTGLTSVVTARGIKITGLSSLSSHFFNAAESDVFTATESSTVPYGCTRRNSDCSFADSINKVVSDVKVQTSECQVNAVNRPQQEYKTLVDRNITSDLNNLAGTKTQVQANSVTSQKKTKTKSAKTNVTIKDKGQTKEKKPRATRTAKSKKQNQTHNLLNQVLTSNLYSPVSSTIGNSPIQNTHTDQLYTHPIQTNAYPQNLGQENISSPITHQLQGFGHFQQDQFGIHGQHNGTNPQEHNPYSQNNSEFRMMDLLLSPGDQLNTFHPQTKFQQNLTHQQQGISHLMQHSSVLNQNNNGLAGGCMPNLLPNQNINHQFGVLPFSQVYQNQDSCQSNKENGHHFLSSDSNFFMHNWNTSSSVDRHSQPAHQVPGNHLNYPECHGNMSHDHSRSNGSLQTIEMSHIADSNGVCENNFNFKIADTKRLNSDSNVSRKFGQPKKIKQTSQRNKQKDNAKHESNSMQLHSNIRYDVNTGYKNLGTQSLSHLNNHCVSVNYTKSLRLDNLSPHMPSVPTNYSPQNHFMQTVNNSQQNHQLANYNTSPSVGGYSPGYYSSIQQGCVDRQANMYNTVQSGDTKITIRRIPSVNTAPVNKHPKHDLMQYWNVRKAGDCRLVFSANMGNGKRKAEEETPTKLHMSHINSGQNVQPVSKKRKCLVY